MLSRDDASDATAGFLDIALVAGNEVDMGMGHGLACGGVDVDPYIEPIGVELLLEDDFDLVQQDEAVRLLLEGQIEKIGNMPGGDHQGMPLAHRILIKNRIDRCGFSDYRPTRREGTEGAGCCLDHAGGLNNSIVVGWGPKFSTLQTPDSRSGSRSCFGVAGCRWPATIQKVGCPARRFEILFGNDFVDFGTKYPSTGESGLFAWRSNRARGFCLFFGCSSWNPKGEHSISYCSSNYKEKNIKSGAQYETKPDLTLN